MFGLFKKKPEPELSDQAKFLLELFKQDGWRVRSRYDGYLERDLDGGHIEVSRSYYRDYELNVRVGKKYFYRSDAALSVPLSDADRAALSRPFHELRDRLREEYAEAEDNEAIQLLSHPTNAGGD